jgi:hypothetical protein
MLCLHFQDLAFVKIAAHDNLPLLYHQMLLILQVHWLVADPILVFLLPHLDY